MTKRRPKNVAASVRQKLLTKAREADRPFNELLQYYAMERFLYRLSQSPHAEKFILKGALMLTVWKAPLSRPTRDIDLLGRTANRMDSIISMVEDICRQKVEPDGLVFDTGSVQAQRITEAADYHGVRIRFRGNLDTARITMQLDIGFGDVIVPHDEPVEYPTLLDLPTPRLRGYSKESAIAEKLEAMVKLGALNSRMKDFFDIWLLSGQYDFHGSVLADAITKTFTNRGTEIPTQPIALTNAFAEDPDRLLQWRSFVRRNRLDAAPEKFAKVIGTIALFVEPILAVLSAGQRFERAWNAPGPWT